LSRYTKAAAAAAAAEPKGTPCSAEDLLRLVKAASGGEAGRALDSLTALGGLVVTADLLAATQVGKEVKKLTKSTDAAVAAAAAAVGPARYRLSVLQHILNPRFLT